MARLTTHAVKRGRQRVGLPPRAMTRIATKALTEGRSEVEFSGSFRRYLDHTRRDVSRVRVFGEHIFIFDGVEDRVITIYHVPARFRSMLRRQRTDQA